MAIRMVGFSSFSLKTIFFGSLMAVLAMSFAVPSVAQEGEAPEVEEKAPELGPVVGGLIPHDLKAVDSTGADQDFDSVIGEKGAAIFFVRSLDWCPYCQVQTLDLIEARASFDYLGLNLVFVSYDAPSKQTRFLKRNGVNATLLSDKNSEIIKAFGLLNEQFPVGTPAHGVAHPAVFVVGPDKTILVKLHEDDYLSNDKSYRNRPAIARIIAEASEALGEGAQIPAAEEG